MSQRPRFLWRTCMGSSNYKGAKSWTPRNLIPGHHTPGFGSSVSVSEAREGQFAVPEDGGWRFAH